VSGLTHPWVYLPNLDPSYTHPQPHCHVTAPPAALVPLMEIRGGSVSIQQLVVDCHSTLG
jgi:hypothetical protein